MTNNSSMPRRIQLRRTKGWRMPPNTVKVCRPGKWGNPFKVKKCITTWWAVNGDRSLILPCSSANDAATAAVDLFRVTLSEKTKQKIREELRGKNLACWCKLGEPCHTDVLLEIANG